MAERESSEKDIRRKIVLILGNGRSLERPERRMKGIQRQH